MIIRVTGFTIIYFRKIKKEKKVDKSVKGEEKIVPQDLRSHKASSPELTPFTAHSLFSLSVSPLSQILSSLSLTIR